MTNKRISRILELKQFIKDIRETELKQSLESLESEKNKLNSMEKNLEQTLSDYQKMYEDGLINIYEFEMFNNYLLHVNKQAKKQREIISKKAIDVGKKKDRVIIAHQEKKMVEIIHNKILKEESKESSKKEQKESDFNFLHRKTRQ